MRRIPTCLSLTALLAVAPLAADYQAGVAAYNGGEFVEAVTQFQNAIDMLEVAGAQEDPQYQPYYLMLGRALLKNEQVDEGIEALKMAQKLKEDKGVSLILGQTYYQRKDYGNCVSTFSDLDTDGLPEKTKGAVSNMLSVCYEKSGNDGMALRSMEEAAKLNPSDAAAQFNYGAKALSSGYTDDAVRYLGKAVELEPNDSQKRRALLNALVRQGRETPDKGQKITVYKRAVDTANALVRVDNSYENNLLKAEAQLGAKDFNGAVTTLDVAIGKKSSDWLPYYYKGQAYYAAGDYEAAVAPLDVALPKASSADDKMKVQKQLGTVHEKLKNFEPAMTAYLAANDKRAYDRVKANAQTAEENEDIDQRNAEIEALEREARELEKKILEIPGAAPAAPPSR